MNGTCFSWVAGILQCAHHDDRGRIHGHSYEVKAFWLEGRNALDLADELARILKKYDHRGLGANERTGEQLARLIGEKLEGCVRVEVNRPLERIGALWCADGRL